MARRTLACVLLLVSCPSLRSERWSRQISPASDFSDWVPLPGPGPVERQRPPIKRQAVAEPRILSEPVFPGFVRPTGFSQDFNRNFFGQASNRQLYLQSVPAVPSAPQNYLTDQGFSQGSQAFAQNVVNQAGQGIRFGLSQPNFPLTQGFVGPQFTFDTNPNKLRPSVVTNHVRFENNIKQSMPLSPQAKPFNPLPPKKIDPPMFIDGYRAENGSDFGMKSKKPLSLQKLKYEVPRTEMMPPPNKAKSEREEVQLLYVPLESLNRGSFNFRPLASQHLINTNNEQYNQSPPRPAPAKQPFLAEYERPAGKLESFGTEQDFFTNFNSYNDKKTVLDQVKFSTVSSPFPTLAPTTPKPKKLKPHQPPLAIFTAQEAKRGSQLKVGDVLASLKNAPSIAVLDSVNPSTAPKVFIGPSNLVPPENYVKFELPYLSNIEHSDKKLRQLPFFVAPLSYKTPQGFAKIPFPSPHVGSVVINSQISRENQPPITPSTIATSAASVIPNSYSTSPQKRPESKLEPKPVTQKPTYSYYSTSAPKTNPPANYDSNYYSFEPQSVSTLRTPKEPQTSLVNTPRQPPQPRPPPQPRQPPTRIPSTAPRQPGSYFLRDQERYNPPQVPFQDYKPQEPVKAFNIAKPDTTSVKPTTTTTKASTYPSQLLETHNPYSINQAFHFSTPLDYHSVYEEAYATPNVSPPPQPSISSSTPSSTTYPSTKTSSVVTEENYQAPNYVQSYSPEIHYQGDIQSSRFPVYNEYTEKPEVSSEYTSSVSTANTNAQYSPSVTTINDNSQSVSYVPESQTNIETQTSDNVDVTNRDQFKQSEEVTRSPYYQYETTNYEISKEEQQSSSQTTPSTTTTRRSPVRNRGRPRYTTTPKPDSGDTTTRTITRRPLRERKPATRPKYETNKATERTTSTSKAADNENTTKYSRGRVRGRIPSRNTEKNSEDEEPTGRGRTQYKASASDDFYGKSNNGRYKNKEGDLAYQRDVLHQNYPVTIQERTSTKDIDAITEPSPRLSSTKNLEPVTEVYDTENAYSYDTALISHQKPNLSSKEQTYDAQTEASYNPSYSSAQDEDYHYRSSVAPEIEPTYFETSRGDDDVYARQTTAAPKLETVSFVTEPASVVTEQSPASYSINNEYSTKTEETSPTPEQETKVTSKENISNDEAEENTVQTTPSYNRVRVRPGLIRQYHQASSTETSKTKNDKRRPAQAVTYRPAFNQRRTTMRIEEIEHDLKTKQVHVRPEVQEINRHPVYRPEPTTEPPATTATYQDTTKRTVFRRRRPSYTTSTTTEGPLEKTSKKPTFEVKSRFRGRRPADRTTEKTETEASTTTRSILHSRYSNRPKFSERFNKKPQEEDQDDQESNYSFNRPTYVEPESDLWSPKISTDSFKPYNPNDIVDDKKVATTERRSDAGFEDIITAKNDYDEILLTVTPATNNKGAKKISDISPTLDALVEQTKTTKTGTESMSTFETMLEEVMKSLEDQDENEYSTNVMKHKGGEIGEIPPEKVITSEDHETKTTVTEATHVEDITMVDTTAADDTTDHEDDKSQKGRRRGFWKKVKVRPVTESIETAESQYYTSTVNRLGNVITLTKTVHDKNGQYDKTSKSDKSKITVTTYKPNFRFIKDIVNAEDEDLPLDEVMPVFDIPKIGKEIKSENKTEKAQIIKDDLKPTEANIEKETPTEKYLGNLDFGTGSPDRTAMDVMYRSTPTEPTLSSLSTSQTTPVENDYHEDKNDGFSFMDYFFGYSSNGNDNNEDSDKTEPIQNQNDEEEPIVRNRDTTLTETHNESTPKLQTTESSYIPEEFTVANDDEKEEIKKVESDYEVKKLGTTQKLQEVRKVTDSDIKKLETTQKLQKTVSEVSETQKRAETESVTPSSFMDPNNVMSTSMSTEVSHETEICFRGKCIKTSKDIL